MHMWEFKIFISEISFGNNNKNYYFYYDWSKLVVTLGKMVQIYSPIYFGGRD
jgi:hypothetical protein